MTACEQVVYGGDLWTRLHGRRCRNDAKVICARCGMNLCARHRHEGVAATKCPQEVGR